MKKPLLVAISAALLVNLGVPQAAKQTHRLFVLHGVAQERPVKPSSAAFLRDRAAKSARAKSKGKIALANLSIDNRTDYNCYVYVDDSFVGSIGPFGKINGWLTSGYHEIVIMSAEGSIKWTLKRAVEDGETIDVILN